MKLSQLNLSLTISAIGAWVRQALVETPSGIFYLKGNANPLRSSTEVQLFELAAYVPNNHAAAEPDVVITAEKTGPRRWVFLCDAAGEGAAVPTPVNLASVALGTSRTAFDGWSEVIDTIMEGSCLDTAKGIVINQLTKKAYAQKGNAPAPDVTALTPLLTITEINQTSTGWGE